MVEGLALLTDAAEQVALSRILRSFRPDLTIWPVSDIAGLRKLEPASLRKARLVAFASSVIVPADLLARFGHGAYNFHPGPPNYPGWAPAHFALYDRADSFGVTFHAMAERVDSGAILDVVSFPIPQACTLMGLGELAYAHLLQLFEVWAEPLARETSLMPRCALSWSGRTNTRRSYRQVCDIPLDISRDELWRRMRAFGGNHYGIAPAINLHGVTFTASPPEST
ncbi:formyltransferase family protein [Bradyrhizobium sp. CIAT3101]|uniref:formyltransferase family protein n=1 Tax=Bradyrhizobium sp. CIAT3101 TaxID=439387 RepID=UPI0024B10E92|nr:formyltransferase family protein [Bradyrhizobium sp. CIAT3101]WFU78771.1 formyltransferase family protein [Bradyrhizobium sp. CIAT3101]